MRRILIPTITALCLLPACSSDDKQQAPLESVTQTPVVETISQQPMEQSSEPPTALEQPSEGATAEMTDEVISKEAVPSVDDASQHDAAQTAVRVMEAFANPDSAHEEWWAELEPLLTDAAAEVYYYVDPTTIPASKVVGDAKLANQESAYVHLLEVPTDAGVYEVLLTREGAESPWRAERLTPPRES